MSKANAEIRAEVKSAGLFWWQIAEDMGIQCSALSVLLRHELSDERKDDIREAIRHIKGQEAG